MPPFLFLRQPFLSRQPSITSPESCLAAAAAAAAAAVSGRDGSLRRPRGKSGGGGAEWAWEAAAGPGPADPFREDWPHWGRRESVDWARE
jgi:hypothetical protein